MSLYSQLRWLKAGEGAGHGEPYALSDRLMNTGILFLVNVTFIFLNG